MSRFAHPVGETQTTSGLIISKDRTRVAMVVDKLRLKNPRNQTAEVREPWFKVPGGGSDSENPINLSLECLERLGRRVDQDTVRSLRALQGAWNLNGHDLFGLDKHLSEIDRHWIRTIFSRTPGIGAEDLNDGELLYRAAQRLCVSGEVYEETGLLVLPTECALVYEVHKDSRTPHVHTWFLCGEALAGEKINVIEEVGIEVAGWVSLEHIREYLKIMSNDSHSAYADIPLGRISQELGVKVQMMVPGHDKVLRAYLDGKLQDGHILECSVKGENKCSV